ncbi:hypothetical protein YPPY54_2214, partial [Yersinia pestis PY-54]
MIYVAHRLP